MDSTSSPQVIPRPVLARAHSHSYSSRAHKPSPLRYSTAYSTSNTSLSTSELLGEPLSSPAKQLQDYERPVGLLRPASNKTRALPRSILVHTPHTSTTSARSDKVSFSIPTAALIAPESPTSSRSKATPRSSTGDMKKKVERIEAAAPVRPLSGSSSIQWQAADVSKKARTDSLDSSRIITTKPPTKTIFFLSLQKSQPQSQKKQPTTPEFQLHPLLLNTPHQTIAYDVSKPPSRHSFIDRRTRASVSLQKHTLSQSATDPPTTTSTSRAFVLRSSSFPWTIQVTTPTTSTSTTTSDSPPPHIITNYDILQAIHNTLAARVDPQEWAALGHGSRAQKRIMREYERRCVLQSRSDGGGGNGDSGGGGGSIDSWDEGVRRIDYLCGKTLLAGIELDKNPDKHGSIGRLLFVKP